MMPMVVQSAGSGVVVVGCSSIDDDDADLKGAAAVGVGRGTPASTLLL